MSRIDGASPVGHHGWAMNFLAHAEVARRLPGSDDAVVLGAMLPDLAHLVPVRLARHRLPPEVDRGWACHLAADTTFHADARFRAAVSGMARRLGRRGWPRWPAHAAAHVSWELLLDGRWVLRSDPARWFTAVLGHPAFVDTLGAGERRRWDRLVRLQVAQPLWASYVEPGSVADRTWRRLQATRVGFDAEGIGDLADLLREQVPVVDRLAEPLVQGALAATVAPSVTFGPSPGADGGAS